VGLPAGGGREVAMEVFGVIKRGAALVEGVRGRGCEGEAGEAGEAGEDEELHRFLGGISLRYFLFLVPVGLRRRKTIQYTWE